MTPARRWPDVDLAILVLVARADEGAGIGTEEGEGGVGQGCGRGVPEDGMVWREQPRSRVHGKEAQLDSGARIAGTGRVDGKWGYAAGATSPTVTLFLHLYAPGLQLQLAAVLLGRREKLVPSGSIEDPPGWPQGLEPRWPV